MDIITIIKEEIEQFDWGKEKVGDKVIKPNRIVYHISEPKNRESISINGLEPRVGDSYSSWSGGKTAIPAIFATNGKIEDVTGGLPNFTSDIWMIDTSKLNNQWFEDKHFSKLKEMGYNNPHIVTFNKIPKHSMKLVHRGTLNQDFRK